jgi:hypothetical protein
MSRRPYSDPWSRGDALVTPEPPNGCADCGRRIRDDWTRCRPCFVKHRAATVADVRQRELATEPEPQGWRFCRLCGSIAPGPHLRHAAGCPVTAGLSGTTP